MNGMKITKSMDVNLEHTSYVAGMNRVIFTSCGGAADAQIVQGLMSVTAMAVNGMPQTWYPNFLQTMQTQWEFVIPLTPSRANGFLNMFERVRSEAERMV